MRVLVAYASKYGCTEKCAKLLAEKMAGEVDLCNLKEGNNLDLAQYDKVVIGGSIYAGKIQKEVTHFCTQHKGLLLRKKLGLFICGMLKEKAEEELNLSFPRELLDKAIAKEFLGGELRFKNMNALEKLMVKMVAKGDENFQAIDMKKDFSALSVDKIIKLSDTMNAS